MFDFLCGLMPRAVLHYLWRTCRCCRRGGKQGDALEIEAGEEPMRFHDAAAEEEAGHVDLDDDSGSGAQGPTPRPPPQS